MDEIDAALDFRNVSIVANYIKVSWLQKNKMICKFSIHTNVLVRVFHVQFLVLELIRIFTYAGCSFLDILKYGRIKIQDESVD